MNKPIFPALYNRKVELYEQVLFESIDCNTGFAILALAEVL